MFAKRLPTFLLLAILLLGLLWWAAVRFSSPAPVTPPKRFETAVGAQAQRPSLIDYERLDARLTRLMEDPIMVGLAVGVVEDGQIRFLKGYGETAQGSGDPVTTATLFRWASLSKGVAGDMVALLASEGRLSLDEPVGRYAASLRLPGGNEATASVADLLTHRLGLFAHAEDAKLEDGGDPYYLRGHLATLHNICPPGTCHAYQNIAYDAAAEIVERVTGRGYAETVRARLFAPLGMNRAGFGRQQLQGAPSWARAHVGGKSPRVVEVNDSYYRVPAAGGVNGSIEDLAIWMLAQMGLAEDVLPRPVLAAVQAPRAATPRETRRRRNYRERTPSSAYGFGWRVFDYAGRRVIGHHGGVQGYRSLILFDPERRTGVVALWNASTGKPNGIEYEVMDMFYRLPFRDWLELDADPAPAAPPEPPQPENEGGTE